jgi:general secretion pathway protein B
MSYILDALKKSDQERQQGTTPGLHTPQAAPPPEKKRRSIWPYLIGAALLLNGSIFSVWLWSRPTQGPIVSLEDRGAAAKAPEPSTVKITGAPETATTRATEIASTASKARPTEMLGGSSAQPAAKETEGDERKKGAAAVGLNLKPKAEAIVPAAPPRQPAAGLGRESIADGPEKTGQRTSGAAVKPTAVQRASAPHNNIAQQNHARISGSEDSGRTPPLPVEPQPLPKTLAPAPLDLPAALQPPPEAQHPAREKPPATAEAPASVQREMPGMSLSFLVYSDKAAERMVSINGKMMREGQEVSPDIKLDEITPHGVILNYRGYRFHKNLF